MSSPKVVKSAIVPVSASPEPTDVTVVSRDSEHDSAIIQAHVPAVPIVRLSSSLPSEGQNVAIAGFPFMQIEIAGLSNMGLKGLAPSLHLGSINAIVPDNTLIEFDATTDHGNSGGPLFDPSTGVVYGVVTGVVPGESAAVQGSFATSMHALWPFIKDSKVRVLSTESGQE